MHRRFLLSALTLSILLSAGSASLLTAADKNPADAAAKSVAEKLPENVDAERFERAAVVLRAKLIKPLGGETGVHWYRMQVIETLKSTVREKFGPTLDIFTAIRPAPGVPRDPGPPAEECTIYLELVNQGTQEAPKFLWRLLDGSSITGISHIKHEKK